jgi:maltose alpha-D-glucosyltransferase/alpha-amylase
MFANDPSWYRDAVIYELHVRAFADSDGDGVGDFRGLIGRLDYLEQLGVTAIWLLPFYPSPLRDDGYDIAEYKAIHSAYGTIADFRRMLREAHRRGMRVITELVVNHTSDQHAWFQRARRDRPGGYWRDFYVWSDTPDRYRDARIIFRDFESSNWAWDPAANAYYWHRFYSHQPDLNFDNRRVRKRVMDVLDFWFDMGVDGLRLDAVPYLFEREGTNCENLPETIGFLRDLRTHMDTKYEDRMLLAEANQWPEDAVAYFGDGDVCNMAFHFPLMPRMFMAIRMEDRYPIVDVLAQTPPIPETAQWALFLRNHDELTLEMVTDEERDYMYRTYAEDPQARINLGIRRRLAPLLGNDRKLIEMMNGLLFSLPGTPVMYYGDELGMGDNIYLGDRNSVRTPMQWSGDRNAGFSRANPQRLYLPPIIDPEYHYEAINAEAEQGNPNSLLWWTRRLIALRHRYQAFGRGTLEMIYPENRKVFVFLRRYGDERILVVANLSRHAQYVELDLSQFQGMRPIELFGQTEFPRIGEWTYLLTLGPHAFYWFSLEAPPTEPSTVSEDGPSMIQVAGTWDSVFQAPKIGELEALMPRYLRSTRWFAGKSARITSVTVEDAVPVPPAGAPATSGASPPNGARPAGVIAILRVDYADGDPETYALPLTVVSGRRHATPQGAVPVARLLGADGDHLLFDALYDPRFAAALIDALDRRRRLPGLAGHVSGTQTSAFRPVVGAQPAKLAPSVLSGEQSNTSLLYGKRAIVKFFRRAVPGINPDLEIGRYLTERMPFEHAPPVAGALEYARGRGAPGSLAILHRFVPNEGDAWSYTVDVLSQYLEEAAARGPSEPTPTPERSPLLDLVDAEPPDVAAETIGAYLESARLLGERTAELHLALSADEEDPAFAPEPFTTLAQRSLYQSMRTLVGQTMRLVRTLDGHHPNVARVLEREHDIMVRLRRVLDVKIVATRIRIHGDYHLGQVLHTGKDFVIIDFEGEPAVPLGERRIKRSAMRDVAAMIRSFHYASRTAALAAVEAGMPEDLLQPWVELWYRWVSAAFLRSYLRTAPGAAFVPTGRDQLEILLDTHLLEKAVYELGYEAKYRPDWMATPAAGILDILDASR